MPLLQHFRMEGTGRFLRAPQGKGPPNILHRAPQT